MEWLSSDVPGDESPSCCHCERQIGVDVDAVALRVGKVTARGRLWEFCPYLFEDGEDVKWFHFDCLAMNLDVTEMDDAGPTDCGFCPEDLVGEPECYELEFGRFRISGRDTWWREEKDSMGRIVRGAACKECIEFAVGEGNGAEMRRKLGKRPHPEDRKKWIYPSEVPTSMR